MTHCLWKFSCCRVFCPCRRGRGGKTNRVVSLWNKFERWGNPLCFSDYFDASAGEKGGDVSTGAPFNFSLWKTADLLPQLNRVTNFGLYPLASYLNRRHVRCSESVRCVQKKPGWMSLLCSVAYQHPGMQSVLIISVYFIFPFFLPVVAYKLFLPH